MPDVIFTGPAGRIEGRYKHSKLPNAPLALILHPHPLHGGTMNNKVAYALYQIFSSRGFSTLRFNFRGVGRSQGEYDKGEGELSDAAAALDWMQSINPNSKSVWVGGFSFGAWIGMQLLMRRPEIDGFVSVAPPTNMFDFSFLAPCPAGGLIVQGDQDDIVPQDGVNLLVERLIEQQKVNIDFQVVQGANHFFTDRIDQLVGTVHNHLDEANVLRVAA
ncbi:MAG: alpha/beta hydrolase [Rickettsiales bacterium]|nr:alpha/beta hydrolase [Rickettsiales bacterium]|tara:strand:+ start:348 stop:1001 length:654 start_codon:yes stop_codon:yes gene_type:complete